jgi:hypothetical protein
MMGFLNPHQSFQFGDSDNAGLRISSSCCVVTLWLVSSIQGLGYSRNHNSAGDWFSEEKGMIYSAVPEPG